VDVLNTAAAIPLLKLSNLLELVKLTMTHVYTAMSRFLKGSFVFVIFLGFFTAPSEKLRSARYLHGFFCACVEQLLESPPQESGTTNLPVCHAFFVAYLFFFFVSFSPCN
jgi:hypothetical protein